MMYLNADLKGQIMKKVEKFVEADFSKSALAADRDHYHKLVMQDAIKSYENVFSENEINVLKKFSCSYSVSRIRVRFQSDGKPILTMHESPDRRGVQTLLFEKELILPAMDTNKFMNRVMSDVSIENLRWWYTCSERLKCEITAVVAGYSAVLQKYRTTKSLVKDHPYFQKFLDVVGPAEKVPAPMSDQEKLVKDFERSLAIEAENKAAEAVAKCC